MCNRTLQVITLSVFPCLAIADNMVHPGTPVLDRTTLTSIGIQFPITGDDDFNASVSVRYRKTGTTNWQQALPLFRVHPENTALWPLQPQFAGSIFDLRPSNSYDIELHLTDPDGGVDQTFTLTAITRSIPGDPASPRVVNVNSVNGLVNAVQAAQPGDIITLADGVYNVSTIFSFASGTAQNPIVIRGTSEEGTILDGGNCPACNIIEVYGSFVHIDHITLRNAQRAIRYQTNGTEGNVVRWVHVKDTIMGIHCRDNQRDYYIADNILEGRLRWPLTYGSDNAAHGNDDGIVVHGFGHVVSHNQISGYADALQIAQDGSRAIDFYGNEVLYTYDDGIEMDSGEGNVRCFRNRFTNTFDTISLQPVLGGPAYVFRNVVVNVAGEQMKFHALGTVPPQETNGTLAYHNTFVSPSRDLYMNTPNVTHHFRVENNLFVGPAQLQGNAFEWGGPIDDGVFDYNGYFSDGWFIFNFFGIGYRNFPNFAAAQAFGVETHGFLLNQPVFASGLTAPSSYTVQLPPQDATLASGSNALDRGLVLPNINDGYTGAAPDLGALELGCPAPIYGPRPAGIDESNEPFGCSSSVPIAPGVNISGVSVNPSAVMGGQPATGTANISSPAGPGGAIIALASSYPAGANLPPTVMIPQGLASATFTVNTGVVSTVTPVTLTASYSGAGKTTTLTLNPPPPPPPSSNNSAKATFTALDTLTQGNWKLKYGADGYNVVDDSVKNPSYGSVTPSQQSDYMWTGSTNDGRALQRASGNDRIAAVWYANAFQMDFNPTDQVAHQIAIYCLDWSFQNRVETISVVDAASNAVLDTRNISNFTNGVYLVWNVTGHVVFRVNRNSGDNAVVNGVFFGAAGSAPPPPPPSASASASFLNTDITTQGNWKLKYGADGYNVVDDSVKNPSYGSVTPSQQSDYMWTGSTNDGRALQRASGNDRIAAVWYANAFQMDFNPTDQVAHQVAVYCLDWSFQNRVETISVVDAATNAVLDSRNISNFTNGVYLVWNVTGHVVFRVNRNSGDNAVVNGVFFGAAGSAPPPPPPSASASASFLNTDITTQGNWKLKYGSDGYTVVDDSVKNPGYASVTPSQQADYVWTGSTNDGRALQRASGGDRIAAVWYGNSFQIDFNPSDRVAHQIALYCLDWSFTGRAETISIVDANTNAVLDTRSISNFTNGVYLLWNVTGHVVFRVNRNSGDNAVVNGVFFGSAGKGPGN